PRPSQRTHAVHIHRSDEDRDLNHSIDLPDIGHQMDITCKVDVLCTRTARVGHCSVKRDGAVVTKNRKGCPCWQDGRQDDSGRNCDGDKGAHGQPPAMGTRFSPWGTAYGAWQLVSTKNLFPFMVQITHSVFPLSRLRNGF